jgi:hypothetical protein
MEHGPELNGWLFRTLVKEDMKAGIPDQLEDFFFDQPARHRTS